MSLRSFSFSVRTTSVTGMSRPDGAAAAAAEGAGGDAPTGAAPPPSGVQAPSARVSDSVRAKVPQCIAFTLRIGSREASLQSSCPNAQPSK